MNWPPDESVWKRIIEDLPPETDVQRFRWAVDAAVQIYADGTGDNVKRWERILGLTRSSKGDLAKLCREINKLKKPPPAFVQWVETLATTIVGIAELNAQFEKTRRQNRREQFYANLLTACTEHGGLKLSVSDTGPLNRVFREIAKLVLSDPPGARGIKDIIKREKVRRASGKRVSDR